MNAVRTIVSTCVCLGLLMAGGDYAVPWALSSAEKPVLREPKMTVDLIAALGCAWDESELRDLLATFRIQGKPVFDADGYSGFLQNHALGVELTFKYADRLDVRLRDHPPSTIVLNNIRFYGLGSSTHAAFKGDLPFGLHFSDTGAMLIARFGPPDVDRIGLAGLRLLRWDTERYALFVEFNDDGTLARLSLQLPVVASSRPGFERR